MPARRWHDDPKPEVPQPTVLVSSRDGAEVPHVAGAARLAEAAEAAGWTVRQTYALADVPATSRRAAHRLASVVVRLHCQRDGRAGWATWHRPDDRDKWRSVGGVLGMQALSVTALMSEVKRG